MEVRFHLMCLSSSDVNMDTNIHQKSQIGLKILRVNTSVCRFGSDPVISERERQFMPTVIPTGTHVGRMSWIVSDCTCAPRRKTPHTPRSDCFMSCPWIRWIWNFRFNQRDGRNLPHVKIASICLVQVQPWSQRFPKNPTLLLATITESLWKFNAEFFQLVTKKKYNIREHDA